MIFITLPVFINTCSTSFNEKLINKNMIERRARLYSYFGVGWALKHSFIVDFFI